MTPGESKLGQPEPGDALGRALLDAAGGRPGVVLVEREDGFITMDSIAYLGGLDARDEWALSHLTGRVLDVGAGAGRAALELQRRGHEVLALDTSPGAIEACQRRGVRSVYHGDPGRAARDGHAESFDSALLLGNNIGLLGSAEAAGPFLRDIGALLTPGGVIVGTASDPYQTDDRLHLDYHERNRQRGRLSGHATLRIRYQRLASDWFDWLIPSPGELDDLARPVGWQIKDLRRGPGAQYAVVLERTTALRPTHPGPGPRL